MNPPPLNPAEPGQAGADRNAGPQPAPNPFLASAPPAGRGALKWAVPSAFLCAASVLGLYYLAFTPLAVPAAEPAVIAPPRLIPAVTDNPGPPPATLAEAEDGPGPVMPPMTGAEDLSAAPQTTAEPETGQESAPAPPPRADAPVPAPQTTPFKIGRHQGEAVIGQLLREAHQAYHAAEYARAGRLYRQVLQREADHRAARLGLGAIALLDNDPARAYPHYARLLSLNPDDALALGGLLALPGAGGLAEGALAGIPATLAEAPLLHFALGGAHARAGRWAEAERAFREARRLDALHPDYAFNLAVSLDRQGRHEAALDYYREAVALARDQPAHFDPAALQRRIATLAEFGAGP